MGDICCSTTSSHSRLHNSDFVESMKPSRVFNPVIQYYFDCTHTRAIHPNTPLPQIDPLILKYCLPEKSKDSFISLIEQNCAPIFARLEKLFLLKKVDKDAKRGVKRKYWFSTGVSEERELTLESYKTNLEAPCKEQQIQQETGIVNEPQVKRLKDDGPNGDNLLPDDDNADRLGMGNMFSNKASTVGTIQPIKDFKEMLDRRDVDLVDKAIQEMQEVIIRYLQESIGDQYYRKALDCLVALREGCVHEEEASQFNSFLHRLKLLHGSESSRRFPYWNMVKQGGISLITSEECADSDISADAAAAFLSHCNPTPVIEENKPQMQDTDDLFDNLE